MTQGTIAFFGHNAGDAAVRRRAVAFQRAGFRVTGYMPHRGDIAAPAFDWIDLGETHDNDYSHRIRSIFAGARIAARQPEGLRSANVLYARNLDMLALAARARRALKLSTPLVYECLDVHHRLTGTSLPARALRVLEQRLLRQCALLVVSSPRFVAEHFDVHYPGLIRSFLVENRLIEGDAFGPRPNAPRPVPPMSEPLRLGWFGNLRCRRSLDLMKMLATRYPDRLQIELRGYPAPGVFDNFEGEIAPFDNISFHGRYRAPDDLETIYSGIDAVWAGDWYEAGANSLWLLPNRIYEGGYFATPALAPAGTETGAWIERMEAGFTLDEPVDQSLVGKIGDLLDNRAALRAVQERLIAQERSVFVETPETVQALVASATA